MKALGRYLTINCFAIHTSTTKQKGFEKSCFKFVTRPYLVEVSLGITQNGRITQKYSGLLLVGLVLKSIDISRMS